MKGVVVYLDDETYELLRNLKKQGKIRSLSELIRSIIVLYLYGTPVHGTVQQVVAEETVIKRRLLRKVKVEVEPKKKETAEIWRELQKEIKPILAKRRVD